MRSDEYLTNKNLHVSQDPEISISDPTAIHAEENRGQQPLISPQYMFMASNSYNCKRVKRTYIKKSRRTNTREKLLKRSM